MKNYVRQVKSFFDKIINMLLDFHIEQIRTMSFVYERCFVAHSKGYDCIKDEDVYYVTMHIEAKKENFELINNIFREESQYRRKK